MSSFNVTRIALLEARMSREIADMIRRYGGEPYCAPAVREATLDCEEQVSVFIDHLTSLSLHTVVFFTGVGVEALFRVAEQLGRCPELLSALHKVTVVCRGPKPAAVLKRKEVPISVNAKEPYTTKELLEAMQPLALAGTNVAIVHYGERNAFLAQALQDRELLSKNSASMSGFCLKIQLPCIFLRGILSMVAWMQSSLPVRFRLATCFSLPQTWFRPLNWHML